MKLAVSLFLNGSSICTVCHSDSPCLKLERPSTLLLGHFICMHLCAATNLNWLFFRCSFALATFPPALSPCCFGNYLAFLPVCTVCICHSSLPSSVVIEWDLCFCFTINLVSVNLANDCALLMCVECLAP